MQKMEVTNFRNFCLKNSGISGLGKKAEFPEIGISGIAITTPAPLRSPWPHHMAVTPTNIVLSLKNVSFY
jgi:hypothetical protein